MSHRCNNWLNPLVQGLALLELLVLCGVGVAQENGAAKELHIAASLVSIEGTLSLEDALKALEDQSGNRVLDYRDRFGDASPLEVTLHAEKQPFWSVIDTILHKKALALYPFTGEPNTVAVVADPNRVGQAIVSYDRVLRVEATKLFAVRDLRDPFQTGLRLSLDLVWEPRLKPILVKHHLDKFEAIDDLDQVLRSTTKGQIESPVLSGVAGVESTIPMELPSREASRLKSVRGESEIFIPGDSIKLEIKDLAKVPQEVRHDHVVLRLDRVERSAELLDIQVTIKYEGGAEAFQSHYGWMFDNPAILRNADGKTVEPVGVETLFQRDSEFGLAYKFELQEVTGSTFEYQTPVSIQAIPFQFEFHDVLLP